MIKLIAVACVTIACSIGPAAAQTDPVTTALIVAAVKVCVVEVHKSADSFAKHFDAFYNPATGLVENNAVYVGDQPSVYQFRKCMTAAGYPLK